MAGKRGLIMGVANDRSIAWGIAKSLRAHGAELAFTYQGEALEKRVTPLAESRRLRPRRCRCDVTDEASIDAAFAAVEQEWGELDFLVHAIAFSDKNELKGRYVDTTRENFLHDDGYLLLFLHRAVPQRAAPLMTNGGSLLTLTYLGAERVMPHYNVMGVAKAALEASVRYLAVDLGSTTSASTRISAGPIKTLAASGIGDFRYILKWNEFNSPLRRNVDDRGSRRCGALSAVSDLGAGVTGEVHACRLRLPRRRHEGGRRAGHCRPSASRRNRAVTMAGNSFGTLFRFTTWGESHGPAIGCVVDGCPPLIPLTEADIQPWLDRRRPGQSSFITQRQEAGHGEDPVRRVRGHDHRHADRLLIENTDARSQGLWRDQGQVPSRPCRLYLSGEIRHPRLSRRRPAVGARNRMPRRGRRGRAQNPGRAH